MDIAKARNIHCVGIKGAGVCGLAQLLSARGVHVCGSDTNEEFFTDVLLKKSGIPVEEFSPENITKSLDAVIYSVAYPESHPERVRAQELGIPQVSYAEALAQLFNAHFGIAVSGSHGKTTTSAMIAYVFSKLGLDPTAVVGSTITQLGSNMLAGASQYFIIEADEYKNNFFAFEPKMLVITSVDYDHPDWYPSADAYEAVFVEYAQKISGRNLIACWDDPGVRRALAAHPAKDIITYGWDPSFAYSASNYRMENGKRTFTFAKNGLTVGDVSLSVIGRHNASNALAALAVCDTLALALRGAQGDHGHVERVAPLEHCIRILSEFTGTARRFEYKGRYHAVEMFDDYAHHPTEIRATLHAARHQYPGKIIWCAFASHTFSRTRAFFEQFADVFHHVDRVLVLDIFSSARETERLALRGAQDDPEPVERVVTARELADAINAASGNALYTPTHDRAIAEIIAHEKEIDILITMGAGDAYKIADELFARAKNELPS